MNQSRIFLVITLLFMTVGLKAQTLVLHHADGSTTDVELFTMPKVQFKNDKVVITSTVLDMEYPKENILRFSYKGVTNAIQSPKAEANYSREDGQLLFRGIKSADKVAVYNAKGIRVPVRLTRSGDDVSLPLSAIPSGVYVLSVNGRTSKFTKP